MNCQFGYALDIWMKIHEWRGGGRHPEKMMNSFSTCRFFGSL